MSSLNEQQGVSSELIRAGVTGTFSPGAALRYARERATHRAVSGAAKRAAERYKQRAARRPTAAKTKQVAAKKLTGVGFYLVLAATIFKDLIDIGADFALVLSVISLIIGPTVSFIMLFYLFYNDVRPDTRKVVSFCISIVVGWVPFVNILPDASISLLLIRFFENHKPGSGTVWNKLAARI